MKKKIFIFIILLTIIIGCGTLVKGVTEEEQAAIQKSIVNKWCYSTQKDAAVQEGFSNFLDKYSNAQKEWEKVISSSDACVDVGGGNISCTYTLQKPGKTFNYMLMVSYNGSQMEAAIPNGDTLSFTVVGAPGEQISVFIYPAGDAAFNYKDNVVCKEKGYNNDLDPTKLSDNEIENYALYTFDFSLPTSKRNEFIGNGQCAELVAKYPSNTKNGKIAKKYVPQCYDSANVDILTTADDISENIGYLNAYFSTKSEKSEVKSSKTQLYCQFDGSKNKVESGTSKKSKIKQYKRVEYFQEDDPWFQVTCTENMTIEYDKPKTTFAGGGFKYTVKLNSRESCTVKQIRKPAKPTICRPQYYFDDTGGPFGGPSDDFVSCVAKCDGGLYSDKCSNKCYSEVYENGKSIENINFVDKNISSGKLKSILYTPGTGNDTSCYTQDSIPKGRQNSPNANNFHWSVCPSARTIAAGEKDVITVDPFNDGKIVQKNIPKNEDGDVYGCVYGWQSNPCKGEMKCTNDCSADSVETKAQQDAVHQKELKELEIAKNDLVLKYKNSGISCSWNESTETYSCTIPDHNTTETATAKSTIVRKVQNYENSLKKDENGFITLSKNLSFDKEKSAFINFPMSYLTPDKSVFYETAPGNTTYRLGGYIFYTDVNTKESTSNDIRYYPYNAALYDITSGIMNSTDLGYKINTYNSDKTINWNIVTNIKNFGSNGQWDIDVNCFYGVLTSNCKPTTEKCDDTTTTQYGFAGLPYLYRTIDLTNVFPEDRTPGYNWTNNTANQKASTTDYQIDPVKLKEDIEVKGNTIYNGTAYNTITMDNVISWRTSESYATFNSSGYNSKLNNGITFYTNGKYAQNHVNANKTN